MKARLYGPVMMVSVAGLLVVGGCSRGQFESNECAADAGGSRMDIPANVASAVYFDEFGNPLNVPAEDMTVTKDNRMCPTPDPGGPGGCAPKPPWCVKNINGKNFCLRCQ